MYDHDRESSHDPDEEEDDSDDIKMNNVFVACYLSRDIISDGTETGFEINTREDRLHELQFIDEDVYVNYDDYYKFHRIFVKNNIYDSIREIHNLIKSRVSTFPHEWDNGPRQTSRYIIAEHNIEWVKQVLLNTYPPPPPQPQVPQNPNSYTDTLMDAHAHDLREVPLDFHGPV